MAFTQKDLDNENEKMVPCFMAKPSNILVLAFPHPIDTVVTTWQPVHPMVGFFFCTGLY